MDPTVQGDVARRQREAFRVPDGALCQGQSGGRFFRITSSTHVKAQDLLLQQTSRVVASCGKEKAYAAVSTLWSLLANVIHPPPASASKGKTDYVPGT